MKKPKAPRVPILESTFELNLPSMLRTVKASGRPEVVLADGEKLTVAVISETRLAVDLDGQVWLADIVSVPCLNNRSRPLLKCPRAHEGNFQSLYYRAGELACRHCHSLRYRSTLANSPVERARIARYKLLAAMGNAIGSDLPARKPRAWRKSYGRFLSKLLSLTCVHYNDIRRWLYRPNGLTTAATTCQSNINPVAPIA